jgi:hypothetical protein
MRNYIRYIYIYIGRFKNHFQQTLFSWLYTCSYSLQFFFFILIIENPNNLMMSSENEICGVREIHCIKIFSIRQILLDHDR